MTDSINFLGSYSGIDQSMVDRLMQIEKLPLNHLNRQKTDITAKQNAWKDVNTRLNSLYDKLKALQKPETFNSMTSKSSNESIVTISASKDAVAGRYDITVDNLATNTRITGKQIDAYDTEGKFKALGMNGILTIKNSDNIGGQEEGFADIEIGENDSLKNIVDKINDKSKDTGINATIINSRLVLTDEETGERGISLSYTAPTTGELKGELADLGLKELTGVLTEETAVGHDPDDIQVNFGDMAELTINGIKVTSDSNTVTDAVLGLTINLNKAHAVGEYDTITVSSDTERLVKAVQDFVDQYNSTMSFIEEQLAVGTVTEEGTTGRGTLAGDSGLRSLRDSLRRMVTDSLAFADNPSTIKDISALGVKTTDKSGRLSLDSSKLLEELKKDPQNVINFFNYEVKDDENNTKNVGFISKLNSRINDYISSKDGLIKSKNESLDRSLRDINRRIDSFNDRIARKEEYYSKMFAALDVAMMEAESQMSWLTSQISALSAQTAVRK